MVCDEQPFSALTESQVKAVKLFALQLKYNLLKKINTSLMIMVHFSKTFYHVHEGSVDFFLNAFALFLAKQLDMTRCSETSRWHRKSAGNLFFGACELLLWIWREIGHAQTGPTVQGLIYAETSNDKGSPISFHTIKWDHPENFTMGVWDNLPPFLERW